jgi:type IV pilus secretin PilQ/predicted competence protein
MTNGRGIGIPWGESHEGAGVMPRGARRTPVMFIAGLAVMLISTAGAGAQEAARLTDVKIAGTAESTTVAVKTGGVTKYQASLIDPRRLVIDFENTEYVWRKTPLAGRAPIKEIRGSQFRKGVSRLVVELAGDARYTVKDTQDGLVVTLTQARADGGTPSGAPPVAEWLAAMPSTIATAAPVRPSAPIPDAAPSPVIRLAQAPTPPATAAPVPPAAGTVTMSNGRRLISLDFKDADVVNLLRILAAESGRNIVVGDDVKGKMSISLRNVPWEQALETILETRGLQKVERGNVLRIVTNEQLTREREAVARVEEAKVKSEAEARLKMAEAQFKEAEALQRRMAAQAAVKEAEARGPLREETIRLSYANPEEVAETLQGILGIPKEGQKLQGTPTLSGGPLIAEPPFSQLYGQQPPPPPAGPISISQDVLAKGLSIRAHRATNTIFLRLYAADLERVKKLIRENFDIPLPQVKIEARMEILDRNALEQIGIQWGGAAAGRAGSLGLVGQGFQSSTNLGQTVPAAPGIVLPDGSFLLDRTNVNAGNLSPNPNALLNGFLPVSSSTGLPLGGNLINLPISALPNAGPLPATGLAFGIIASKFNVNLALQALAEQGKTRTLARPEIVTVENSKAAMSLGEEIPYATVSSAGTQIQFKEALLKLEVTPTVIREGDVHKIKMMISVENNSRGTVVNLGNSGNPPAINRRKAETLVLVREGERLVIGGVATSTDAQTVRKVPLLGDIPFLGWLFKQREDFEQGRELAVFVTPSILRAPDGSLPPIPR